jgi:predicted DNA-binding antitoxin AbrB/MazE fold protein
MTQITEAVYSEGVLKPVDKLALRETQRVRLIIEPLDDRGEGNRSVALKRLLVGIGEHGVLLQRLSAYARRTA